MASNLGFAILDDVPSADDEVVAADDILAGATVGEDNIEMVCIGEVISTLVGGASTANFGFDSMRRTLIWRARFVLCADEKFAARIPCGTVSIGAFLSNEAAFATNF